MNCTGHVQFGPTSQKALARLSEILRNQQMAMTFFGAGFFGKVVSGGPLTSTYEITTTDWVQFAEAAKGFGLIAQHAIKTHAANTAFKPTLTPQERRFWRCMMTDPSSIHIPSTSSAPSTP